MSSWRSMVLATLSSGSNQLFNFGDCSLEATQNFKFCLNSLNFLGKNFLLVLRDGDAHGCIVSVNGVEESSDCGIALGIEVLSFLEISICRLEVEDLLNLLNFLFSNFKFSGNCFAVFGITDESVLCFIEELKSGLCLGFGLIPTRLNTLDIGLEELGFVRILKNNLALGDKFNNNVSLGVKLGQRLLLSLNQLINILNT